ncbi:MAG: HEPN domain-containing protein [Gammaproteobacteria bacterium]|nr:HEPN domain-containing protein [Gammaproteobacteria bacterium]
MFLTKETLLYLFLAQAALPTTGKIRAKMLKLVGEAPLVDFVSGTLARELFETQEYQAEEGPAPLTSIPAYVNLAALADRLVDDFNSLPWKYTVTAPLPSVFSDVFCPNIGRVTLSDTVSICRGDEAFANEYPLASGIEKRDQTIAGGGLLSGLLIGNKPAWAADRAYLQVSVEGFIGKYTSTEPLLDAIGVLRAFFGLGLALRLFKPGSTYQPYPQREKLYIHRRVSDAWVIEEVHELESRHSETIRDLKLHDLDGALDTDAKRVVWMNERLSAISAVFRAGEHARNIVLGAQWLLDSHCGSDELLQFVQAAVVVEILLGGKASSDLTGLGELLSNRCAYLIATSHAQRNELLQDFRDIYEVRSKIVHRGKSRLDLGERTLFNKLRWMCRRIIQEEVELLGKDGAGSDA